MFDRLWASEDIMTKEDQEPVERLEEIIAHPADKTFNALHDKGLVAKKELNNERRELANLLGKIPNPLPKPGTKEYDGYLQTQNQIQSIKAKISKTHDELMEILRSEEKISREIQGKDS
jgi:hypothetical protein